MCASSKDLIINHKLLCCDPESHQTLKYVGSQVWISFHILLIMATQNQGCSYRFCRDVLGCRDFDEATSGARFKNYPSTN